MLSPGVRVKCAGLRCHRRLRRWLPPSAKTIYSHDDTALLFIWCGFFIPHEPPQAAPLLSTFIQIHLHSR